MEDKEEQDSKPKLSLETVREFLVRNDGKVKQDDLVNYFRSELTSPSTKVCARQEFKDILQLITAVKMEDGEKYIVLTKQNQENQQNHFHSSLFTRKSKRFKKAERLQRTGSTSNSPRNSPISPRADSHGISCSCENINRVSTSNTSSPTVSKKCASSDSINTYVSTDTGPCPSDEELEDDIGLIHLQGITTTEKEWMVASSKGNLYKLKRLFNEFPELLQSRDFVFGYTALHWASKIGRSDILNFVIDHDSEIINTKSHGGYTPLHIASISGKDDVIVRLINFGANIHSRDHSGKKPKDLVKSTVAEEVQRMLGRIIVINTNTVLQTNLHSLQRNKHNRNSSFYKPSSRENSPDTPHKALNTVQRSMSLLKTRMHSPMMDRAKSSIANMTTPKSKLTRETKSLSVPEYSLAI